MQTTKFFEKTKKTTFDIKLSSIGKFSKIREAPDKYRYL